MRDPKFAIHDDIIKGLVVVELDDYCDERGQNFEGYDEYKFGGCSNFNNLDFKCDSFSRSKYRSFRGFHSDFINHKLISCLYGEIQFFALDTRKDSPTYKNIFETYLRGSELKMILLEPEVANAHQCISSDCIFAYKLTKGYVSQDQQIFVNKDELTLKLKIEHPIMSSRDTVFSNYLK